MADLRTDAVVGTRWWEIKRVAEKHGLRAEKRERMTASDLEALLDLRVSVLLAIQAWVDRPARGGAVRWEDRTEDGHHVVAVGHDAERFYLEDPAIFGVGYIPRGELERRWFDFDERGTRLDRFGLAFRPRRRATPDDGFARIE